MAYVAKYCTMMLIFLFRFNKAVAYALLWLRNTPYA